MPDKRSKNADIVESDSYHEFVPAKTLLHVGKDYWNGLCLNVYEFSGNNEGIATPGIEDIGMGVTISGNATGNWSLENSKWSKRKLPPGNCVLIQQETPHAWQWYAEDIPSWRIVNLILDHNIVNTIAEQNFGVNPTALEIPSDAGFADPFVHQLALELKAEAEQQTPFGKLFGETAARLLALHYLRKYSNAQCKPIEYRHGLPKYKLQQVIDYMQDNLDKEISLDSLAMLIGLSSYHFMRLFKQSTGLAPHQYLMQCRITRAKELLRDTDWPMGQIAEKLGYCSQSHFSNLFKRSVGVTPSTFRKGL